jgi:FAD/FMN-containing dehydrogenase
MSSRIPHILALFSSLALVAATVSAHALVACTAISATGIETKFSTTDFLNADYVEATHRYWSQADVDQVPACVVFPKSGSEVSGVVSVLLAHKDVGFAMKSGGHNPNVGFSSVDGGVLISFQNLADTVYSSSTQTAAIGPGARWGDVITALDSDKRAVVGGRIGK